VHYFDGGINEKTDVFEKGENWYRANFPLQKSMQNNDLCIDATPMYLYNPLAPARIKALIPNAKVIILLRNPVERAISHYFHVKRHGFEPLSIEQAFANEKERLEKINSDYKTPAFRLHSYQSRGDYLPQIQRYQEHFDQKQILILHSDDLFNSPEVTLKKVFKFLTVDASEKINDLKSQNIGNNKTKVSAAVYQKLERHFTSTNERLFKHIKQRFDW